MAVKLGCQRYKAFRLFHMIQYNHFFNFKLINFQHSIQEERDNDYLMLQDIKQYLLTKSQCFEHDPIYSESAWPHVDIGTQINDLRYIFNQIIQWEVDNDKDFVIEKCTIETYDSLMVYLVEKAMQIA